MIFSKLDTREKGRVAQVCSSWRDAVYAKRCWKGLEANFHLKKGSSALFSSLMKRGIRRVHILSLRRRLREVLISVPNLESLNLSGTYNISNNVINSAFCTQFPNLKVLNLSLCKQLTDDCLKSISAALINLEVLDLSGCSYISNKGLFYIGKDLKQLKRLNLRSCWNLTEQGIEHLTRFSYGGGNEALEFLGLQNCPHLSDEAIKIAADGCPTLRAINVSFCMSLTDQSLKHLARMQHLEELNLSSCENITDMGIAYLTDGATQLRVLDLSFCDKLGDQALAYIAQSMFQLRSLNLRSLKISDDGLIRVAKGLHELEDLQVGQCFAITDKSVHVLAEELKTLRAIDLYGCKISSPCLEIIVKLPKLQRLNLVLR